MKKRELASYVECKYCNIDSGTHSTSDGFGLILAADGHLAIGP